ncbi:2788_t:CDS:2 [Entrophospora sp. SA101]|nr:12924_t:CDS:2 [Entrophospora sp. SA101]CAJ0886090.1 2788_t:CDS:2 [Entrophospora sp. SA101]
MSVQIHIILIFAGWSKKGGLIADRLDGVELERKKHPSIFKKTWDEINIHLSAKKFINEYNKQEKKEFMKHRSFDDDEYEPIATIEQSTIIEKGTNQLHVEIKSNNTQLNQRSRKSYIRSNGSFRKLCK